MVTGHYCQKEHAVPSPRFEPTTFRLKVRCSLTWPMGQITISAYVFALTLISKRTWCFTACEPYLCLFFCHLQTDYHDFGMGVPDVFKSTCGNVMLLILCWSEVLFSSYFLFFMMPVIIGSSCYCVFYQQYLVLTEVQTLVLNKYWRQVTCLPANLQIKEKKLSQRMIVEITMGYWCCARKQMSVWCRSSDVFFHRHYCITKIIILLLNRFSVIPWPTILE